MEIFFQVLVFREREDDGDLVPILVNYILFNSSQRISRTMIYPLFLVQSFGLGVNGGSRSMNKLFAIREQLFLSSISEPGHRRLVPGIALLWRCRGVWENVSGNFPMR